MNCFGMTWVGPTEPTAADEPRGCGHVFDDAALKTQRLGRLHSADEHLRLSCRAAALEAVARMRGAVLSSYRATATR